MRQVGVLREHTHARTERTSMIGLISQFEVVVVTLVTNHLELVDAVNLTVGTIA